MLTATFQDKRDKKKLKMKNTSLCKLTSCLQYSFMHSVLIFALLELIFQIEKVLQIVWNYIMNSLN